MNTVVINKGESVHLNLTYNNSDGTPIDLTGATLLIPEALPAELLGGTVVVQGDPLNGNALLFIPASLSASMGAGKVNWIRISMETPEDVKDVSPKIWIDVQ